MLPLPELAAPVDGGPLHASVVDRIADQLKNEIGAGSLPAGCRLVQGEISARLGVSGTTVREAFHVLERSGLISWDGRRGVRVFQPSVADLIEGYGIRGALESLAVRIATPILDHDQLHHLAELIEAMERLESDDNRFLVLNAEFHGALARASQRRKLIRLIDAEQTATSAYIRFLGGVEADSVRQSNLEHRLIYTAILTGNADLAASAMESHLTARAVALRTRLAPRTDLQTSQDHRP